MAITSDGYVGQVSDADWASIYYGMGYGAAPSVVVSGLDASVGAGTRALALSSGTAVAVGVRMISDAAVTLNAAANSSGATVRSYAIAKYTWAGAGSATTLEIKAGGASLPSLTQTPGVTWEMPLATFSVANGASVVSSVAICKPTPRMKKILADVDLTLDEIFATSPGVTIGTVAVADPGWVYRVRVNARVRGRSKTGTPGGSFELNATCNGTGFGRAVAPALAPSGSVGVPCVLDANSPAQNGPCTIAIVAAPNNLPSPGSFEIYGLADINRLSLEQFPV